MPDEMLLACDEILTGQTENDELMTDMFLEDLLAQTIHAKTHCSGNVYVQYSSNDIKRKNILIRAFLVFLTLSHRFRFA